MSTEPLFSAEPVPPRSGMSGTAKLFLGIGAGCLTGLVLACGGTGFFVWQYFKQISISEDPVVIQQEMAKIVQLTAPPGLEPKFSMSGPVPFVKQTGAMCFYTDQANKALLTVAQLSGENANAEQLKEIRKQLDDKMDVRNARDREVTIDPASAKQREVEIHGEAATFTISTGKDKQDKEVRVAEGNFKGEGGPALLYFLGDAEAYSEEAVEEMIDSLK